MSQTVSKDPYTDVVELCALLQCLGFHIKSLDISDNNVSQEIPNRTVTINCKASGFNVVLESANLSCSCPSAPNQDNSSFWQVSGMTGGKQYSKECGSGILRSLPKAHRDRLTKELQDIVRCIKEHNESDVSIKEGLGNKSASMIEIKTPENRALKLNTDTPTRYRSLDTLTTAKGENEELPTPGRLQKHTESNVDSTKVQSMCQRQSTYTLSSTPGSLRRSNKTSSPIQTPSSTVLENMIAAEKMAEKLQNKLSNIIKDYLEDNKPDSSISSMALDVSKIPVIKGTEFLKPQFASSPNLSGMGANEDFARLKRVDSASTSNLVAKTGSKDGKLSRLPKISSNLFRKNSPSVAKIDKEKSTSFNKSKLNNLLKSKTITPGRTPKIPDATSVNTSKKKLLPAKSTIPRLASKKE